jgi:hypothetical protein
VKEAFFASSVGLFTVFVGALSLVEQIDKDVMVFLR